MSLDRFRLFVSAARHVSFTQASRERRISQPAVSRQLKILQEDFGITLFKKKGRGVELTDSGRAFLKEVTTILSQVEDLKKSCQVPNSESLTIAACRGPSAVRLPSLMARFKASHPLVNLTLFPGNSTEIRPWLKASTVDLAFINTPPASPLYYVEPYRSERLTAFVFPTHPLAKKPVQASDSVTIPLIVRAGRPTQTRTEKEILGYKNRNIKLTVTMRCGSSRSVKETVARGAGVGILYHDAIKQEIDRGEFKPVKIPGLDLQRRSYIVYSKEKPLSRVAQEFLALLRDSKAGDSPGETMTLQPQPKLSIATRVHLLRSKPLS